MHITLILAASLWVCGARSTLGRYFYAKDESQSVARAEAIKDCQTHSLLLCYSVGCRQD